MVLKGGCQHCSGDLVTTNDAFSTVTCNRCGCIWETRNVLVNKGNDCYSTEQVYEDIEDEDGKSRFGVIR